MFFNGDGIWFLTKRGGEVVIENSSGIREPGYSGILSVVGRNYEARKGHLSQELKFKAPVLDSIKESVWEDGRT